MWFFVGFYLVVALLVSIKQEILTPIVVLYIIIMVNDKWKEKQMKEVTDHELIWKKSSYCWY